MRLSFYFKTAFKAIPLALLFSCVQSEKPEVYKPAVVSTNEIISDAVSAIGGSFVAPVRIGDRGGDPHQYLPNESDIIKMASSNLIIYNGLGLEGRLEKTLFQIGFKTKTVAVAGNIQENNDGPDKTDVSLNPHIWMDVSLWKEAVSGITDALTETSPINEPIYRKNEELYLMNLNELDKYIRLETEKIPEEKRVLVTVHNSFDYFGRAYGFKTVSIQSTDTGTEASASDIRKAADIIVKNGVTTVFPESSASMRSIRLLQAVLAARGYAVKIGGVLYADTLGKNASYIEMIASNVDTIVTALADREGETQEK